MPFAISPLQNLTMPNPKPIANPIIGTFFPAIPIEAFSTIFDAILLFNFNHPFNPIFPRITSD
jgi:hypothetical protein